MNVQFPEKALEQHAVALGKTGAGKSFALRGLVERLLVANKRVCIIDPKGDWYGLKSSRDGRDVGFPVVIFGGEHADVPLNQFAGAQVAELVATGNRPCILDFGGWMVGERTRFWIEFAHGLFKHNRAPLWLVIDEIHNFAPQGKILDPDAGKCLHWTNRLASEGRGKGIRILMASQRPQKVHKDTLTCAETLIAMRVIHPRDRDAVKEWIDGCGDPKQGTEVLNSLAQMPRGEAWVWSPEIGFLERVKFPEIATFDSFAAPQERGNRQPSTWAEVDLDEVKKSLAKVIEQAKAEDPKELRKQITDLRRQLKESRPTESVKVKVKEVSVIPKSAEAKLERLSKAVEKFGALCAAGTEAVREAIVLTKGLNLVSVKPREIAVRVPASPIPIARNSALRHHNEFVGLGKCERALLSVLSQFPEGCSRKKLILLAGYAWSGSTQNALGKLRSLGYAVGENSGQIRITEEGLAQGPFENLPQGQALVEYWLNFRYFGKCERTLLRVLSENPEGLDRENLLKLSGYDWSGSTQNALGALRTSEVIVGHNNEIIRLSDELLEAMV